MILTLLVMGVFCYTATVYAKGTFKTVANGYKDKYTFKVDMDGDGKQNTLVAAFKENNGFRKVSVKMDGKNVLSMNAPFFYSIHIQYISLSKKAQFLYFHGYGDSGMPSIQSVYQYDKSTKKLKKILDLENYLGTAGQVVKVSNNTVTFSNGCGIPLTGRIKWNFAFIYKNNRFTLKSNTATVKYAGTLKTNDGYDKYFAKSQYVVETSFSAYTKPEGTKIAFTASKGKVLKLLKIKLYQGGLYFQFSDPSGKKGWVRGYQRGSYIGAVFCGINRRLAGGFYG